MTMELRDYQKDDLNKVLQNDRYCLFSDPGTGKTAVFCMAIKLRYELYGSKTVLIVPNALFKKTQEDVVEWTEWCEEEVAIVSGTPLKRQEIYKNKNIRCFIISANTFGKEYNQLYDFEPEINQIVVDEMSYIYKSHDSQRTQALYSSSVKIKYIILCTGTPVSGRYNSAYPILALCAPLAYGTYKTFMNYHAVYSNMGFLIGWKNPLRLAEILKKIGVRHTFSEVYKNSPEDILILEKCELDSNVKNAYLDLERDALLELEDEMLDARNPAVKAIKCRRLLAEPESFNLVDKEKENGKDEVLKIHFQTAIDSKSQIIVFASFVGEQERIANLAADMGLRVGLINGSVSDKVRGEVDKGFRDKNIDVIVANPTCSGVGFNWQSASEIIFADLNYDDSEYIQAKRRGNRGTRTVPLRIYILTYGTKIEKRIMKILSRKRNEFNAVLGEN